MTASPTRRILQGAATLPPDHARRVVAALSAKAETPDLTVEELMEISARAMQAAMELQFISASGEKNMKHET